MKTFQDFLTEIKDGPQPVYKIKGDMNMHGQKLSPDFLKQRERYAVISGVSGGRDLKATGLTVKLLGKNPDGSFKYLGLGAFVTKDMLKKTGKKTVAMPKTDKFQFHTNYEIK